MTLLPGWMEKPRKVRKRTFGLPKHNEVMTYTFAKNNVKIQYPCDKENGIDNCWFVFDVSNPKRWKIFDWVVCDKHGKKIIEEGERSRKEKKI